MKKIILDTDMGSDCDDAGALAVIHNLSKLGKCELVGVLCSIANEFSPVAVKAINSHYGKSNIPIGQTDSDLFLNEPRNMIYTKNIATEYLESNPAPVIEHSVELYRKLLAHNDNVTIISVGFLNNLASLLNSKGDDISPLNGVELVREKVSKVYIMGGNFSGEETQGEYNIRMDIPSAQTVTSLLPVPAVYIGWEAGVDIMTGHTLWQLDNSPVQKSYELFACHYNCFNSEGTFDRHSWDPLTAYIGITDDYTFAHLSENCTVTFDDEGFTRVSPDGKDNYVIVDDTKKAEQIIEKYMSVS